MGLVSSHANAHANAKRLRFRCLLGSAIPAKAVANVAELIWLDVAGVLLCGDVLLLAGCLQHLAVA